MICSVACVASFELGSLSTFAPALVSSAVVTAAAGLEAGVARLVDDADAVRDGAVLCLPLRGETPACLLVAADVEQVRDPLLERPRVGDVHGDHRDAGLDRLT